MNDVEKAIIMNEIKSRECNDCKFFCDLKNHNGQEIWRRMKEGTSDYRAHFEGIINNQSCVKKERCKVFCLAKCKEKRVVYQKSGIVESSPKIIKAW